MSYGIISIKSVVGFLWDKNQYNFKTVVVSTRLKTSYVPSEKIKSFYMILKPCIFLGYTGFLLILIFEYVWSEEIVLRSF